MDAKTAQSLLNFAEAAGPGLRGLEAKTLLGQLEQRYPELQLALQWLIEHQQTNQALRLVSSLVAFWMASKRLEEGANWFEQVLNIPGGDEAHRCRALYDAGYLIFWTGDDPRSSALQHQALQLAQKIHNPTVGALALAGLARIALRSDVEEARRLCREALALTEGNNAGRSGAMHVLGVAAQMAGDFVEARQVMSQRIALAREEGNLVAICAEAGNLSMVERQLGNLEEAERLAQEAMEIAYRRGDELMSGWLMNGLAAIAVERDQFERAATLIGIAEAILQAAGGAWPPDELIHYEQTVATLNQAMGLAAFKRVRNIGHSMTPSEGMTFALETHDHLAKP